MNWFRCRMEQMFDPVRWPNLSRHAQVGCERSLVKTHDLFWKLNTAGTTPLRFPLLLAWGLRIVRGVGRMHPDHNLAAGRFCQILGEDFEVLAVEIIGWIGRWKSPNNWRALLRMRRCDRPRGRYATDKRDELATIWLIDLHPIPTNRTARIISNWQGSASG
jgi:hypothetical protein